MSLALSTIGVQRCELQRVGAVEDAHLVGRDVIGSECQWRHRRLRVIFLFDVVVVVLSLVDQRIDMRRERKRRRRRSIAGRPIDGTLLGRRRPNEQSLVEMDVSCRKRIGTLIEQNVSHENVQVRLFDFASWAACR